jgi:hypothetical protein
MPLVSKTFDQLLDFTRTTAATFVGSNGLVQTTPASVNLFTQTQQFDNAAWTKTNTTVTANSTVAPDGTSTADTLTSSAGAGVHYMRQVATVTASTAYAFSFYVKAGTHNFIQLINNGTAAAFANFDLANGVAGPTGTKSTASITSTGNGWYRCTVVFDDTAVLANDFRINIVSSASAAYSQNWTTTGTETVFIWGAQLQTGSTATTYTRNNGGVYPARFDYDPVTLQPKGIQIEEQRTNLLLQSNGFTTSSWNSTGSPVITANAAISPDGTSNAFQITSSPSGTFRVIFQDVTTTAVAHTFSIYLKSATGTNQTMRIWVDTSPSVSAAITVTPQWQRFTVSGTTDTSARVQIGVDSSANAFDVYAWGAQVEAGAFATSYIPTVASQVTRTADQCSIVAPMFAPWYNQSEGTFVVEADSVAPVIAATYAAVSANDNSSNNRNSVFFTSGLWGAITTVGGVNQASIVVSGSYTPNAIAKLSYAYATNNFAFSVNGSAPSTDTSGTVPSVDRLFIGSTLANNQAINGHIRSIRYYPTRLSDAQLQALTA